MPSNLQADEQKPLVSDCTDCSIASLSIAPQAPSGCEENGPRIIDPRGDLTLRAGESKSTTSKHSKSFRVCSRTLSRTSPVFERMLYGFFGESTANTQESGWTVSLPEDSPVSLELFLYIAHGFTQRVPQTLSIDHLFNLTKLTHYYDATAVLKPWIPQWVSSLREPSADDELQMYKMLWINLELGQKRAFGLTARRIIMECSGQLRDELTSELEVFPDLIERIQAIRDQTLASMLNLLRNLSDLLVVVDEKPRWCKHACYMGPHRCESMILGSIVFCLTRAGLWPIPDVENITDSIVSLYRTLMNLVIHDIGQPDKKGHDHHGCNPKQFLTERLQRILAEMADPVLECHRKQLDGQARKLGTNA